MPRQSSVLPTKPQKGQFGGVIYTTASFQILKKIGQGASGIVYWVIDKATGQHLVLKKIPKVRATKQEIEKEVKILEALQAYCHKYILCYTDYFEDGTSYYLVTEHLDGYIPLNQLPPGIDNQRLIDIICNLVRGLQEMHQLKIAHRDIKPDNILVDASETGTSIKYIDFGVSCQGDECSTETVSGTPSYIAPELITDTHILNITLRILKKRITGL
jgi:serine/threonine protein kinase